MDENGHWWLIYLVKMVDLSIVMLVYQRVMPRFCLENALQGFDRQQRGFWTLVTNQTVLETIRGKVWGIFTYIATFATENGINPECWALSVGHGGALQCGAPSRFQSCFANPGHIYIYICIWLYQVISSMRTGSLIRRDQNQTWKK